MDIQRLNQTNLTPAANSGKTDQTKDNSFQHEIGRDALGAKGDARNVLIGKVNITPPKANNDEVKLFKFKKLVPTTEEVNKLLKACGITDEQIAKIRDNTNARKANLTISYFINNSAKDNNGILAPILLSEDFFNSVNNQSDNDLYKGEIKNDENIEQLKQFLGLKTNEEAKDLLINHLDDEDFEYKVTLAAEIAKKSKESSEPEYWMQAFDYTDAKHFAKEYKLGHIKDLYRKDFDITKCFTSPDIIPEGFMEKFNQESEKLASRGIKHPANILAPIYYLDQITKMNKYIDICNKENIEDRNLLRKGEETSKDSLRMFASGLSPEDIHKAYKMLSNYKIHIYDIREMLASVSMEPKVAQAQLAGMESFVSNGIINREKYNSDSDILKDIMKCANIELIQNKVAMANELKSRGYNGKSISKIINSVCLNPESAKIQRNILNNIDNGKIDNSNAYELIKIISGEPSVAKTQEKWINKLLNDKDINRTRISTFIASISSDNFEILKERENSIEFNDDLKELLNNDSIELYIDDYKIFTSFYELKNKNDINEIPIQDKKTTLRQLIKFNADLFNVADEIKENFPLVPKNQEEYCSFLPLMVKSVGIDVTPLDKKQANEFNQSMSGLSESLANLSDKEFAGLNITQEYGKDDFIKTVYAKVKDLKPNERQKVYDYYGFELHENNGNEETGFSIVGYPANQNNNNKLAKINDEKTKAVIEDLRADVIRFSENNPVHCSNPTVEKLLNEVVSVLPETRTMIGKAQHGSHDFDVMQHSLNVMQKISQDPKFKNLNESDQKVMLLASLLHDITKAEGHTDRTHAKESSFDTFFIGKKFNLTKDEELKLYTLCKNHEWLGYANTAHTTEEKIKAAELKAQIEEYNKIENDTNSDSIDKEEITKKKDACQNELDKIQMKLTKRLQSVAYDLRQENMFDMAEIFTHADLHAVKKDNSFHDKTEGESRLTLDGTQRSFGESANVYAGQIREMIGELQKSQPILPSTKVPKGSTIKQALTVNADGTTNIKGVYINNNGLVVIKYNEVEDWEAIGFDKGSVSRGISAKGIDGDGNETDVDTGNIKFIAHGLDYPNQLTKFDAFGLIDSDALLSVSYMERPESKYRLFRPQGVLLDVDTKNIHGGGNTDAGSGCGKNIQDFKDRYIFGGEREDDRLYLSNMVKNATGMTDEEYIAFVKKHENKPFTEIEPKEIREKIIKAYATINSNTRIGNRAYNEMYASNPTVSAVFAYSENDHVGDALKFVEDQDDEKKFLQKYAIDNDVPMIVFGD